VLFDFLKRVARGFAFVGRDEDADVAFADFVAEHRAVFFVGVVDDAVTLRHRQEVADEAEEAAGRNDVVKARVARVARHLAEGGSAIAERRHHVADELIGDVELKVFVRLAFDAVDFLDDDLRFADLKFVAFTAHRLDEDA